METESLLQNTALVGMLGVALGTVLSTLGSLLTQFLSHQREDRKWVRERAAHSEDQALRQEIEERDNLRELYHQCVLSLSVYLTHARKRNGDQQPDLTESLAEVHQWLSLLAIRHPSKEFLSMIDNFLDDPDEFYADKLRKYVLALAKVETRLFGADASMEEFEDDDKPTPDTMSFIIDPEFRKLQMLDGVELPRVYQAEYDFKTLPREHKQRILDIYFHATKPLPKNIQLNLPVHTPNAKHLSHKIWEAKMDPSKSNLNDVLDAWGKEYDNNLASAASSLSETKK